MLDFLKKPEKLEENYWALLIEPQWVSSLIWQINDGKVEVISSSIATRWENSENLLEAIDASLSSCTQNLADDVPDPTKTVFGVPNSWIEKGNIKEEYLEKLKIICKDLSLIPSGFVVLSEAISHLIKQEEESPLSGIVVGVSDENLDLSIFSLGKLIGTTTIARSISIEDDITEGLSRLNSLIENFPSRIILYNQKEQELEEIKNNLYNADWNKIGSNKFIHTPKLEILDPAKKIMAIALAGGSELGAELIEEEVVNIKEPVDVTPEDLGFAIDKPKLPKFNFHLGNKPLIIGGLLILLTIVIVFSSWWFLPKATVTLFVTPKKLEENITIEIEKDLNAETIEVVVSGEKTVTTTGIKTVGERAKGQVKIQNGTAFPINLPNATVLLSSSDLKFQTTKSASISGALSPSSPGTMTIDVEAVAIGSEYNLAKDEIFKVANYPKAEVDATAVANLTGGTSREIQAVSENDKKKVFSELEEELLTEAKTKLLEKITMEQIIIESSLIDEVDEEIYSNKVGDEASNLKLTLSLKVFVLTVSKEKLALLSRQNLNSKVPSGFVLRDDQIVYSFAKPDEEKKIDVRITANLLPEINPDDITKKIVGRYPVLAESYLSSVPGFVRAEFRIKPLFSGKLGTLPHLVRNIKIEISSEK